MADDDPTSIAHALFIDDRTTFDRRFERFLTSLETPIEARRAVAGETVAAILAIVERLRAQGVL